MRTFLTVMMVVLATCSARAAELVMFEEAGCVWCQRWHAEIGPGYPYSDEGRRAPLRRVDLPSGIPPDLKLKRPVTATPTFVLIENGQEIDRLVGYPGADFFYPLVARMIARLPTAPPPPRERQAMRWAPSTWTGRTP